jgi:GT2 family glycosyltransferase
MWVEGASGRAISEPISCVHDGSEQQGKEEGHAVTSVRIQLVAFENDLTDLERCVESLRSAARILELERSVVCEIALGDCSESSLVNSRTLKKWNTKPVAGPKVSYCWFGANLGHGGGHNALFEQAPSDFAFFVNPDTVVGAHSLLELFDVLSGDPSVGIADARQIPMEHPKAFDLETGETSWCSGAFSGARSAVFREVGGFDSETFFLYGDDVDLSWRIRSLGSKAVYVPSAVVFHDKRLDSDSVTVIATNTEKRYSMEAALYLAHKWSDDAAVESLLDQFRASQDAPALSIRASFLLSKRLNRLPTKVNDASGVAYFSRGTCGEHRW